MHVLVVSDTHLTAASVERMPPAVWAMAEAADVVLHAGDVIDGAVLAALAERATVHAVLGNNDAALRGELPEALEVELAGVAVAMVHDSGPTAGRRRRLVRRFPTADVIVFGHSHDPVLEAGAEAGDPDGPLLVNPGSPVQRRRQPVHTVVRLELVDGQVAAAELVEVGPLAGGAGG